MIELEEAIALFEEGLSLVQTCDGQLKNFENKVASLLEATRRTQTMNNFEEYLLHTLDGVQDSKVKEAMKYSLMAGGKTYTSTFIVCGIISIWCS